MKLLDEASSCNLRSVNDSEELLACLQFGRHSFLRLRASLLGMLDSSGAFSLRHALVALFFIHHGADG
jgi:hypothetical protein